MLPADYARCPGARADGDLLADCEHCARRVCWPVYMTRVLMMAPPDDVLASVCAYKIEVGADDPHA